MRTTVGVLLVAALAAGGCVAAGPSQYQPQGPLEPLVVGTEQYLALDWKAEPRGDGAVVWGYANNSSPYTFDRLRLLVEGIDPEGKILVQTLVWSLGLLGANGRNYFEAAMPPAPAYRVRVFSLDRVESDGGFRRGRIW
jgi:hypothetical protein